MLVEVLSVVLAVSTIAACATPYQPKGFSGGYSETRLAEDLFQVSFIGNGKTSKERVNDFSLLRSAELALQNGFRYFVIVRSETGSTVSSYTTPSYSHTTGSAYQSGRHIYSNATTTTYGGETDLISKPDARYTILCFKDRPAIQDLILEAEFVAKSIRDKYGISQ
jgi:hypothetical protein